MKRAILLPVVAVLALAASAAAQLGLASRRAAASPALAEGAFAALGAFRSVLAEVVWFRADRLQAEGRYVELAQLASTLALLEPHTPEVWSFAAWNLAYNVSVMMNAPEDRWRWVEASIRLLRDEGLKVNPREPELYRELAWTFELKIGANLDSAAPYYREKWAETVRDVRRRGAWEELGMEPMRMTAVERFTGFDDWTNPQLSAIYWALKGIDSAAGRDRRVLETIVRQAMVIYSKNMKEQT